MKRREKISREEGREEGRGEESKRIAMEMVKNKVDIETIVKCTGLTKEEIKALAK